MSTMSGGPGPPVSDQGNLTNPGQLSDVPAWAGNRAVGGTNNQNNRSFSQIIAEEKVNRNILEIRVRKVKVDTSKVDENINVRSLTFDEVGELIFDILKIKAQDCLTFDYYAGRFDVKQIQFKPGIPLDQYVTQEPLLFKGHEVEVKKQMNNITRVTFKNVPINVPNEEILHLCKCYGTPVDNKVFYETMSNQRNRGMRGSTRYVDIEFNKGFSMMNYYWMEGPLSGDQGRRVLVLHNGQISQCSNCLKRSGPGGCKAGANGKACSLMNTPRAKMFQYMESLRQQVGYVSLKIKHLEQQAKNFPSLPGFDNEEKSNMCEDYDEDEIVPVNPLEEKDNQIANLEKQVALLKEKEAEHSDLKQRLIEYQEELVTVKSNYKTSTRKLSFTKKVTEERILDMISDSEGFHADPVLIGVYSATLNEDDISFPSGCDESNAENEKQDVLKSVERQLEPGNLLQKERFLEIKNQVLEKVKTTQKSRSRSSSRKRNRSNDRERDCSPSANRPRTSGIPLPLSQ